MKNKIRYFNDDENYGAKELEASRVSNKREM